MEKKSEGAAFQELSQWLYREVQAGTSAPEAIGKVRQAIEEKRKCTVEQLRDVVTGAANQAFRSQQPDIEDALLQGFGEENWDIRTYEIVVGKIARRVNELEAWKLLKRCERKFGIKFSSRNKFITCQHASENLRSEQLLAGMLDEDPSDEIVKAFQQLNEAAELRIAGHREEAEELASQITLEDTSLHLHLCREMIKKGFVSQGANLAMTATDVGRGMFDTVANELFDAGHAKEAAIVIEPLIRLGIVRNGSGSGPGPQLDALNLLAKCARLDTTVKRRFEEEMGRLRETGELPPEYWKRVMLLFQTGRVIDPPSGRYRQSAKKLGIWVRGETKKQIRDLPTYTGQVGSKELPELDESGAGKKRFQTLLEQGALAQATIHLAAFRGETPPHIIDLYERQIYSALSTGTHPLKVWNDVLDADQKNRGVLILATKNLLVSNKIDEAMALFTQRHGGSLKNGRTFGQQLFETGKRGNDHPSRAALMVLADGHPKVAVEIIKPILLNYVASKHEIPRHVLEAFARCAAVDAEIRNEFLEQLRDYRKHRRMSELHVDNLLATIYGEEKEKQQEKVSEAKRTTEPNGGQEDEEQYIGRVVRSRFFQDPHTMLRAQPIDKTAALVAGGSHKRKK